MSNGRRYGAHENRGAGGARGEIWAVAARSAGRLLAALRALCGEGTVAAQPARRAARRGQIVGGDGGLFRATESAEMAFGYFWQSAHHVIAGLDPAIHPSSRKDGCPGHRRAKRRRSSNGYARA